MPAPKPVSPRAWLVWMVAVTVYFLAVLHRSSMAVAGLVAAERFDTTAAALSTFVMLQLLLYTAMQVPVGVLLDRFGPRLLLIVGVVLLIVAQTGFAFAETYPQAVACRVLVGVGDAMVFICVLRLVVAWFPASRTPLFTQLTGSVGQAGALAAAVPMTWSFQRLGWTPTYLTLAAVTAVMVVALLVFVRDAPGTRVVRGAAISGASLRANLSAVWAQPGTRLGFWTHFTTQFSATVMVLLWGFPYLVRGQGLSSVAAGGLLTVLVLSNLLSGPLLGACTARFAYHRSTMALSVIGLIVTCWTAVLVWPGSAPVWLLTLLVVVLGLGPPASMIGFDFARTSNPRDRMGAANGIINQAGFSASLILIVAVGLILDWRTPTGELYGPDAFRWAMSFQYVLWTIGVAQIWRYRRRTRAVLAAGGGPGLEPSD